MANINLNTTELMQVLDMTPATHNIMLVGLHGIGKSEILTGYYNNKGMKVVALFLGQMSDPGDILGLPTKNPETGRTDFMPPYWFPVDGKPIVLFLDELNRARPEILQTVMDLALNRKLAGRPLPEGSRVIAAVNAGDQYQLTDLDPALVSRFNVVNFRPTVQEWLLWARKEKLDNRVTDFIEENQMWLDRDPDAKEGADTGLDRTPDRRAWKRVSDMIKPVEHLTEIHAKAVSSIVGAKAASAFMTSMAKKRMVSGKQVLLELDKVADKLKSYKIHELSVVNDAIFRYLETEKSTERNKPVISANINAYFDMLTKEHKEAAAHFAQLYVSKTYPNAVSRIARECGTLAMCMVYYVQGIK